MLEASAWGSKEKIRANVCYSQAYTAKLFSGLRSSNENLVSPESATSTTVNSSNSIFLLNTYFPFSPAELIPVVSIGFDSFFSKLFDLCRCLTNCPPALPPPAPPTELVPPLKWQYPDDELGKPFDELPFGGGDEIRREDPMAQRLAATEEELTSALEEELVEP
jgi:hypothetical protein